MNDAIEQCISTNTGCIPKLPPGKSNIYNINTLSKKFEMAIRTKI